jgi:hypothetical protein
LVGPSRLEWGSFPSRRPHRRQQVPSGRMRRGTSSACVTNAHTRRRDAEEAISTYEDTSFTRSGDPCTSISISQEVGRFESVSKSGKPAQSGGTDPGPGRIETTHCAARRASPLIRMRGKPRELDQVVRDASEKEDGHGHRPCEETRAPSSASVRRNAVAEVGRQHPGLE